MKKVTFALILLIIIALPFVFANKGASLLEDKGYSVTISEKTELYLSSEKNCAQNDCIGISSDIIEVKDLV